MFFGTCNKMDSLVKLNLFLKLDYCCRNSAELEVLTLVLTLPLDQHLVNFRSNHLLATGDWGRPCVYVTLFKLHNDFVWSALIILFIK